MGCYGSKEARSTAAATVYIAIYNPTDPRDPNHWAIYIDDPSGQESIQQLIDKFEHGGYRVAGVRYGTRPQRSGLFRENILVGWIDLGRVNAVRQLIQNQFVDNVGTTWNCQNWAMEALGSANRAGLMRFTPGAQSQMRSRHQNWQ